MKKLRLKTSHRQFEKAQSKGEQLATPNERKAERTKKYEKKKSHGRRR